jgi:hypothetical protein
MSVATETSTTTTAPAPRLRQRYREEVSGQLREQFEYANVMQIPTLQKIVVNMGIGDAAKDSKLIDGAIRDLAAITGQKPRSLGRLPVKLDVPGEVRAAAVEALRNVHEQAANGERAAMLRRQIRYLLAGDDTSRAWALEQQAVDLRKQTDVREWSPRWPLIRSTAVTAAVAGDPEPLRRFVLRHPDTGGASRDVAGVHRPRI